MIFSWTRKKSLIEEPYLKEALEPKQSCLQPQTGQLATERSRHEKTPQGLPPSNRLCSTLAAVQRWRPGGQIPLSRPSPSVPTADRGYSCPRAFIRNQVWEILWLQGFCLVLRWEVSSKLFSFTVLLGPSMSE